MSVNFIDLARDRLGAMLGVLVLGDTPQEYQDRLRTHLAQLDAQIKQVQEQMVEQTDRNQAGPLQRVRFALNQGMPGLAIQELEEALQTGIGPAAVKPLLCDLYCDTGQPEKALELISGGNINDPALGSEPARPRSDRAASPSCLAITNTRRRSGSRTLSPSFASIGHSGCSTRRRRSCVAKPRARRAPF